MPKRIRDTNGQYMKVKGKPATQLRISDQAVQIN
jgi:hypothetical protein